MDPEISITIHAAKTGQSETLPVALATTTVQELCDWSIALFGLTGPVHLFKDGKRLDAPMKLEEAGVASGDLLAAQEARQQRQQQQQQQPAAAAAPAASGGLDFSSMLQGATAAAAGGASGGLDFSNLLMQGNRGNNNSNNTEPVYYDGMTLNDAWDNNTQPEKIVKLLQTKEHLFKELNYHQPMLAEKIRGQPYEKAVLIFREEILKGGIKSAVSRNTVYHKEQDFRRRLEQNPNDAEAKEHFDSQKRREKVQEQYFQMMQEYPESLGRVLMLYISAKVNGHTVEAFVDSGAQSTIMSKKTATACGLMDMLDVRFKGVAVGVGQGIILGRIHLVQLQLGDYHFPVTLTIMDDPPPGGAAKDMPFLLGLDMLKRHTCSIDLENQVLKFRLSPGKYMETKFLHEKDLEEHQGGTKGFCAEKSNQELAEMQRKREAKGDNDDEDEDM